MNNRGFTVVAGIVAFAILIIVGISAYVFFDRSNPNSTTNSGPDATLAPAVTQTPDSPGTIRIEARDGIITNVDEYDSFTYLAETSRGFEAYLANKDAQVSILFTITREQVGSYAVYVYTSDDGLWENNDRNATFFFDNSQKLLYNHTSRDTKGMVWEDIGQVSLTEGDHFVMVTKRESTGAAFSFTTIKLVPVMN
ncbi:hypothetical protein COY32_05100 [candidate division WWE3 bacterium CG_4_10_14_0_2_um_filter_41_14]|uniref:Uncharacterized protein n=1 Tax=candidate division WWE3 bacterium CG_4_10_14_0_2_um_filter_41_14 TaxID=1975072 RepID=A0A2M7THB1_UNCKA|nr:MAG: hypothetical protein COY32_05100 [candidate division WWE3 bacterium CG_4_10_14_0_2_um_filter_41_14]